MSRFLWLTVYDNTPRCRTSYSCRIKSGYHRQANLSKWHQFPLLYYRIGR